MSFHVADLYPMADLLTLEDLDVRQAEDCPICMESFSSCNDKTMTECGHCFHTSCLMKNAAHNGFGCPYCRKVLAESPKEEEDEDEDEWTIYDDEEETYSDFALRGARWLFQRINNEEIEEEEDRNDEEEEDLEEEPFVAPPPFEYVLNKMQSAGMTYEDLVKYILLDENFGITDRNVVKVEADLIAGYNKVYTKIRQISATYQPPNPLPVFENIE